MKGIIFIFLRLSSLEIVIDSVRIKNKQHYNLLEMTCYLRWHVTWDDMLLEMTCILVGVFLPFYSFLCTIVDMDFLGGCRGRYSMIYNPPIKSVPITTRVVISNLAHCEVYSIQLYVIKFVSDLWQVGGFLQVFLFPTPIKLTATIQLKCSWKCR